ncbi:MAG: putative extracellular nuclease, partial [Planctomycetota bacterium]
MPANLQVLIQHAQCRRFPSNLIVRTRLNIARAALGLGLATLPIQAASSDLYFSEYVEGSSNNKALEIYNDTGGAINLSDYSVQFFFNGSTSAALTINLTGTLLDGDVFVLAHSLADGAILAQADQTDGSAWFNGDDAVALRNGATSIDVIGQIGFDPGSEWGSGDTSTQNNTLRRLETVTDGDTNGGDAFIPSAEWNGFQADSFSGLGGYPAGPVGMRGLVIGEIQGAGHASPLDGASVTTSGIVTAVASNGFYLQDPIGDGDALTSDGIFVFTNSSPSVAVGDEISLTATVDEYSAASGNLSITELTNPTISVLSSSNPLPALAVLGSAGSLPPTEIIDDDSLAVFDPSNDGIDFYETFEGMRVQVSGALAVSPRNKFDEIYVVTDGGGFATGLNSRFGITVSNSDFNPERIQVQIDAGFTPAFDPTVSTGDDLGNVIGVMGYSFGNFEVIATEAFTVTPGGLTPETSSSPGRRSKLSIASYNVLNLDPKLESIGSVGGSNDIDDDIGDGRFDGIAAHIVNNLRQPDIVALQEIQDNDGAELTGVTDASLTYQTLIAAIEAIGGPTYDFRDLPPNYNADGGQPGGNIRCGYLFNPARLTVDDDSLLRLIDTNLGDGDAFASSRKPLVASFDFRGYEITLINNHFASKGGSSQLFGSTQPPVNGNVDKRSEQAEIVNDYVLGLLGSNPDANVIVLGDLNEFQFFEPLQVLEGQPTQVLFNLTNTLLPEERFSYVFKGNSQALDHILVSSSLAGIAEYDAVHVNSDNPAAPSDHDPLLARFNLPRLCQGVTGTHGAFAELKVCGEPLFPALPSTATLSGVEFGSSWLLVASSTPTTTLRGILAPSTASTSVMISDDDYDGIITFDLPNFEVSDTSPIYLQAIQPGK